MKILLIDVNCKYSSTGKIVYDLYTRINASGDNALIAYGRGPLIKEKDIVKFSYDLETLAHAFLTRLTGLMGYYSFFSTHQLKKIIERYKPDVIHIHELHSYFVNIPAIIRYMKEIKIPIIWTHHCEWLYTGKCGYAYSCDKWKSQCGKCPELKSYPASFFFDFTAKMQKDKKEIILGIENLINVFPSEWLANRARETFLNKHMIKVVNNGIDTEKFYRRKTENIRKKLKLKPSQRIILGVAPNIMNLGGKANVKGGIYIVELAKKFERRDNITFILVGTNDESIKYENNLIFVPMLTSLDLLAEYYSLADVFVICSKCENFPTTCVEALCCGCKIAGFNVGGTHETVKYGSKNFVEYGNIAELARIVEQLLDADYNYEDKYRQYYSKQNMYEKYNQLYDKVILKSK